VLETLRYADEVNKAQSYFRDIPDVKPDEELLDLAETLIAKKTAPFQPDKFHDRYVDALHALIDRKLKAKGGKIAPEPEDDTPKRGGNVVDLMAALKKSLEKPGGATGEAPAKKPARKPAAAKKPAPAKRRAAG
jgi:DNA end-binding protein Ku